METILLNSLIRVNEIFYIFFWFLNRHLKLFDLKRGVSKLNSIKINSILIVYSLILKNITFSQLLRVVSCVSELCVGVCIQYIDNNTTRLIVNM